jgi:hypothetical protein
MHDDRYQALGKSAEIKIEVYRRAKKEVVEFLRHHNLPDKVRTKSFFGSLAFEPSGSRLFYVTYGHDAIETIDVPIAVLAKDGNLFFFIDPKNRVNVS